MPWGAIASVDPRALQSLFRADIDTLPHLIASRAIANSEVRDSDSAG